MSPRARWIFLVSIGIAVLVAALYWQAIQSEFINYDDPDYVTNNPIVQRGLTTEGLEWAFGHLQGERTYWHPLTWMSHMLDCQLFGLNPAAHHAVNVLFHIANSILLLLVLSNLTGAFWRSAAVAAIFAVHPLQVETVAWVTERKNLLSTLFLLLTTAAYSKFARTKKPAPYVLALVLFACGLMSKPAVVTLPFIFLLLDFWPLNRVPVTRPWRDQMRVGGRLVLEKLPFFVLSAASALVTMTAHERLGMKQEVHGLPLIYRMQNAIVSYGCYLKKVLFPFDLSLVYPHPGVWPIETVLLSALVLIVITAFALWALRKRPYIGVGWFWFLGVLVPAIGIIQVGYQSMADRFVYVPIIGVLIMLSWGAVDLLTALRAKPAAICAVAAGILIYFAAGTASQLRHWKDSETVFRHAAAVTSRNYVAHYNLALTLLEKGRPNEAEPHAQEASRIYPKRYEPFTLLGAINDAQNMPAAAASNYQRALAINPDLSATRYSLAVSLLNNRQLAEAKQEFLQLTQVDPPKPEIYAYLGQIFTAEKNPEAAIQQYRQALKINPDWPAVLNNLAWLLATTSDDRLRNGAEALRLAQQACALSRDDVPMYVGTLAAAYAELGRFEDAVATARRAQALAREKGAPELAERNAELLKLYEAQKPARETP